MTGEKNRKFLVKMPTLLTRIVLVNWIVSALSVSDPLIVFGSLRIKLEKNRN